MRGFVRITVLAASCSLLVGCGTNVKGLLEEESRLWWRADQVIEAAEDIDPSLVDPIYEAETAKNEACEPIIKAAKERASLQESSFGEEIISDFTQVFVLIVPVGSVERCAESQNLFAGLLGGLCRQLERLGVDLSCSD